MVSYQNHRANMVDDTGLEPVALLTSNGSDFSIPISIRPKSTENDCFCTFFTLHALPAVLGGMS